MTTDLIAFIILIFIIMVLLINNFMLQIKNKKLKVQNVQEILNKTIIADKLMKEIEKNSNASLESSDGFLKFITQSRDWAFKYIEDVQAELLSFKNTIEPKLQYAEKYISLGEKTPAMTTINEISMAYEKLKKIMPEEDEK